MISVVPGAVELVAVLMISVVPGAVVLVAVLMISVVPGAVVLVVEVLISVMLDAVVLVVGVLISPPGETRASALVTTSTSIQASGEFSLPPTSLGVIVNPPHLSV